MVTNGFISYIAFIFLGIGIVLIIIAVILLIRYIKQVTAFKKYKPAWEKHKSIYDDFAIELNHWYDSGLLPKRLPEPHIFQETPHGIPLT